MQLLKNRDFSTLISDTFNFIKENWKHLLTNLIIFGGLFVIFYSIYNYIILQTVTQSFNNISNGVNDPNEIIRVMDSPFFIVFIIILVFFGFIASSFVPIYMVLHSEKGSEFDYKDILEVYKENFGRFIIFILVSILLAIPIIIVFYILFLLSILTIVDPFFMMSALMLFFSYAFYEFLYTKKGAFEVYGYSFKLLKNNFFATTGAIVILLFVLYIFMGIMMIPAGLFTFFADLNTSDPEAMMQAYTKLLGSPMMSVTTLFTTILSSIISVGAGIIYFSQKESIENISAQDSIDDIGKLELE